MIYNTRYNDTTESQKENKICFDAYFQYSQSKIMDLVLKKLSYMKVWE